MIRWASQRGVWCWVVVLGCLMAQPMYAGVLPTDANSMLRFRQGQDPFNPNGKVFKDAMFPGFWVDAVVEYAVYAPGQFALSFPGLDPSNGLEYVYAYQIFNQPAESAGVSDFSIGLQGDEIFSGEGVGSGSTLANIGFLPGTGDVAPVDQYVADGLRSLRWYFNDTIPLSSSSDILIFTGGSPSDWEISTVAASYGASNTLPGPVPEPATLTLLSLGGMLSLHRRKKEATRKTA